ncbi:NAD(P)/FAD-dependent oxidoreductase [Streptomyces sp. NPDC048172]|uniref:NAD(P)/FAD-dependent oxidoreductase n=1 Tax=Streptomyces sp. NPDC048172 TaxID=3365505 RepID=UPI0037242B76
MTERSAGARRIAVVGSGVAGLSAAHVLRQRDEVTLYEADDRLGGHAHTHDVAAPDGRTLPVDTGFIVHNPRTYPLLTRLFDELGVASQETAMSMSVRCQGCGLEYAGAKGPRGLFASPRHALRPAYLRMIAEVPVFHRRALRLLATEPGPAPGPAPGASSATTPGTDHAAEATLGDFLRGNRFSAYFVAHFVTPLVSAVWSCAPETALRHPARPLFRFLEHHGMLSVGSSPTWRTVTGGSRTYVRRIAERLAAVHTSTPVRAVRRRGDGVELATGDGEPRQYDAVVLAVHPDQALRLLDGPTEDERRVLGALPYSRNSALLHTDPAPLPRSRTARAAWNYLMPDCRTPTAHVRVSYDMNRLQRLDSPREHVVSLGAEDLVRPGSVLARMAYEHPLHTPESVAAQRRLPGLSRWPVAYAGAYHGWGFHEDGCRSGIEAARTLGVSW